MNNLNVFKIYNASAGTGKTFNLVKEYLVLLLNNKNIEIYKNILAITFTNKAVNEMKKRILGYLIEFSGHISEDSAMIDEIKKETGLKEKEIFLKSKKILKNLIKNYSSFEILTIDKLTQKIIRSFTYELGIDSKYEVEIDQNEILLKAVDSLISKIEINNKYFEEIINFSFEKTENEKSWDVTNDLLRVSKLLLEENNYDHLKLLKKLTIEDFKSSKGILKKSIKRLKKNIIDSAKSALQLIEKNELKDENFIRQTIPKHFKKIISENFERLYNNKLKENLKEGKLHSSKCSDKDISNIKKIRSGLENYYKLCRQNIYKLKLYNNILNNLSPLSILGLIKRELEEMKSDGNFILISEFNKLVNDEIKNQPAPFIFEKIGAKFNHFFIDEFQDTSRVQWENLKPLLENSLSAENSSLTIAGDPKQAIYGWRGGDVYEFMELVNKKNPFFCEKKIVGLDINYRSSIEIIDFNNKLFRHIKELFKQNLRLNEILNFPKQKNFNKIKGSVTIDFYDSSKDENSNEYHKAQTLLNINEAKKRNYSLKDICIIVRKKKEGIEIGDYLVENNIPIISSEVLNLSNSPSVNLIISLINFSTNESNSSKLNLCKSLCNLKLIKNSKEDFLLQVANMNFQKMMTKVNINNFSFELEKLKIKPIYEAIEYIIDSFQLAKKGNSYVQFLLDFANEYSNKYQTSFIEFLDFYNQKKDKLNIISPAQIDAVEIITIHKSKGLEFPIVIYPFANINIHKDLDPKIWINFKDNLGLKIKKPLININKELKETDEKLYNEYKTKLEIDNINLLYVVLTRAKNELYIISDKNFDKDGNEKTNLFSGIFISYLKKHGIWNKSKNKYEIGSKYKFHNKKKKSKNIFQNNFIVNSRSNKNILINRKYSKAWVQGYDNSQEKGNIFHLIMSEIYSKKDINFVLNKFHEMGEINFKEKKTLTKKIKSIINHKELEKFFSPNLKSYNEREIINKNMKSYIPDRLVYLNRNNVIIIDYKTGLKKPGHINQLKKYEKSLSQMGLKTVKKILVYINQNVEIKII